MKQTNTNLTTKPYTLIQAIEVISQRHFAYQLPLTAIEQEDGSGFKFNYRLSGENKNRFINLKSTRMLELVTGLE